MKGRQSDSDSESETNIKINSHMGPVAEKSVSVNLQGSCGYIYLFQDLIQNCNYPFVVGGKVNVLGEEERMLPRMLLINRPMGPEDEMIIPGDWECSYNMFSLIWYVEMKISRSICKI